MIIKRAWLLLVCGVFSTAFLTAQNKPAPATNSPLGVKDSIVRHSETKAEKKAPLKRIEYFKDTIRRERRKFDSSLFKKKEQPSTGDYAEDLGKIYQLLSQVPEVTSSFLKLKDIDEEMDKADEALAVLKEKIYQQDRTLNVRNLQMFSTLLEALSSNTGDYSWYLRQYDSSLSKVGKEIAGLQKDSLMLEIFRDSTLKNSFEPQLVQLKTKWRLADSLVTENAKNINSLKSQALAHSITIGELQYKVDAELKAIGPKAFGKEREYLWEHSGPQASFSADNFQPSINSELQLASFYFSNTDSSRAWLILAGVVFFAWIAWNFFSLKRFDKLSTILPFDILYINTLPVAATLIFTLSLAPLFDLHAPVIYIEAIQFLLMIVLTFVFRSHLARPLFFAWCIYIFLFLLLPLTRIMGLPVNAQRWGNLLVYLASFVFGLYNLLNRRKHFNKWLFFGIVLYTVFNLLAIACNVMGRITFSQVFGDTAVYSFAQTVGLSVFVKIIQESFLLQVQASRTRKKYPEGFDFTSISSSVTKFAGAFAGILWLIVFTMNLNLFDALFGWMLKVFNTVRQVGNFSFTIGGIILFFSIIWLANFLQKYIAYFFGDTGDDAAFDDKGQRTRLMVTRLILLIAGFLLAVAASGLAVDRITVIIGALGVGVGLGLQNIVNNFVSGIILIFDRPLRIGDTVDIGDKRGRVKEIGIRSSTLVTDEGAAVIIPNGDVLSHNIVNWTTSDSHVRESMSFIISTPSKPEEFSFDFIKAIVKQNENVIDKREPEIVTGTVNAKTMEIKVFYWVKDFNKMSATAGEIRANIYQQLQVKGYTVE